MGAEPGILTGREERLAVAVTGGRVQRVVHGLWLTRIRLTVGPTDVWVEVPLPGSPFDDPVLFAARTRALRTLAGDALSWLALPTPEGFAANTFLYAPTVRGALLCEAWERATGETFFDLGRQLGEFHGLPLSEQACFPTEPVVRPLEELDRSDDDGALAALHQGLAAVPDVAALAREAERSPGRRVLLHGRWSTGSLLVCDDAAVGPAALGGADCWVGPREHDLGYLIGELLEDAADAVTGPRGGSARWACTAVEQFVTGYRSRAPLDGSLALRHSAHRVVSHLAANGRWRVTAGRPSLTVREVVTMLAFFEAASPWLREVLG